jgi:dihydrodipicolinate synthase/N-acetylneuraminate lyase
MREFVIPLYAFRSRRKGYEVSAMKTMMDQTGQAGGRVRPPLNDLRPGEVKEMKTMLKRWRTWL